MPLQAMPSGRSSVAWRLMEERRGRGVRMRDIAEAAGVSRQAVYDHFGTRAKLLVATTHYVDEVRGLEERPPLVVCSGCPALG
jgi:AcrR family transcriptional regulator